MPRTHNIFAGTSVAQTPSGYKIIKIELTNHENRKIDINEIVVDFSITESLYQTYCTLNLNIKDNVGLLEEFEISGQEKIRVVLEKEDFVIGNVRVDKTFYSTEYPVYMKFPAERAQVYKFVGVSEHAFLSQFKRISRSVEGEIKDIIEDIFIKDLHIDPDRIVMTSIASPRIKAIIPNFFPIKAIHWLLRRCFDKTGGPFYVYETLDNKIRIDSHVDLIKKPYYREYDEGRQYTFDPSKDYEKNYLQRLHRMLEITSDIKLTKFLPGTVGAFSSRSHFLNFASKSYEIYDFNYEKEFDNMVWIDKYKTISSQFKIESENSRISELPESYTNRISLNNESYDDYPNYHNPAYEMKINKTICYEEQLDSLSHEVKIHGDPTVRTGQKMSLKFAKTLNPELIKVGFKNDTESKNDLFITGEYLLTSVIHNFDTDYYINFKAKKDSYAINIEA